MPTPPLPDKERRRRKRLYEAAFKRGFAPVGRASSKIPSATSEVVRRSGLDRNACNGWLAKERAERDAGRKHFCPDETLWAAPAVPDAKAPTTAAVVASQRAADRAKQQDRDLRELRRHIAAAEDLRAAVFKLAPERRDPPQMLLDLRSSDKGQTPLFISSDIQAGEVVRPGELDGVNSYDLATMRRRYEYWLSAGVRICQRAQIGAPGAIYLRGGDAISGDIHDELVETNEVSAIRQVQAVADMEIAGIRALADAFGHVVVISVAGNHGRLTKKPRAKRYTDTNLETVIHWMIEQALAGDARVELRCPDSGDAFLEVYRTRILLTHGDRIGSRGGQGFIGPSATIVRGARKVHAQQMNLKRPIDLLVVGHFHTPLYVPGQVLANGALAGYSEFAHSLRADPHPASQTVQLIHPTHGPTAYHNINVQVAR